MFFFSAGNRREIRIRQSPPPTTTLREQIIQNPARWRRHSTHPLVRPGEGLQHTCHGPARSKFRGLVQLLLAEVHNENGAHARRSNDQPH